MFGQFAIGGVQFWFIATGMLDTGLGVVWDGHLRHPVQELQRADMRTDPAGKVLAASGLRKGVTAATQPRHEEGSLEIHIAGPAIIHGDLVAGVIDEPLLPGAIFLPQNYVELARPVAIQFAETAVTVAVRMSFAILF